MVGADLCPSSRISGQLAERLAAAAPAALVLDARRAVRCRSLARNSQSIGARAVVMKMGTAPPVGGVGYADHDIDIRDVPCFAPTPMRSIRCGQRQGRDKVVGPAPMAATLKTTDELPLPAMPLLDQHLLLSPPFSGITATLVYFTLHCWCGRALSHREHIVRADPRSGARDRRVGPAGRDRHCPTRAC
jgi:hypothetical protein